MDQEQFEHIEKYLQGELTDLEAETFENLLKENVELGENFELVKSSINAAKDKSLETQLESIHKELYPSAQNKARTKKLWVYLSGAAAIITILVTFWIIFQKERTSSDELFAQYFTPFPNYITTRNSPNEQFVEGLTYYSKGEFGQAIKYLEGEDTDEDMRFYLGVSYLKVENLSQAIITFLELQKQSQKYQEQLRWYLSLAYLKNKESEKAIQVLRKIKKGEYEYVSARELLEHLNNQKEKTGAPEPSD